MTLAYAPAGVDFAVNTTELWEQSHSHIAPLASGGFVVVWQDDRGPGLVSKAVARVFDAQGEAVTGELALGDLLSDGTPNAIGLASGNFLVTWKTPSWSPLDGLEHGRIYDPSGNPVGAEFLVGSGLAALTGGGFVATWTDQEGFPTLSQVRAQVYDGTGAKVGSELTVNAVGAQDLAGAQVAALPGGGFVVTWKDFGSGSGSDLALAVQTQVFDSSGAKVGGTVTIAEAAPTIKAMEAVVTGLASGNYVSAWYSVSSGPTPSYDIFAQIMTPGGAKVGGLIVVNTVTANAQLRASITALPDGGFALVWDDEGSTVDGLEFDTKMQVFDGAGTKVGPELLINPGDENPAQLAQIAALANGDLVVTWADLDSHIRQREGAESDDRVVVVAGEKQGVEARPAVDAVACRKGGAKHQRVVAGAAKGGIVAVSYTHLTLPTKA